MAFYLHYYRLNAIMYVPSQAEAEEARIKAEAKAKVMLGLSTG